MHLDVQDLRNFYYRSALGRTAQSAVRDQVLKLWPDAKGMTVVGFGFANPLLRPYLETARRVIALMPGPQGVIPWPAGKPNVSVLCEETWWPIDTGHADRLIIMHGLETSEHPTALLQEAYRVLGPGGRAIIIVPDRSGLWSRSDKTPFGYGRPYSLGQLEAQLKKHGFMPERHVSTLHRPPSPKRFWSKTSRFWEAISSRLPFAIAGGVILVEISKKVERPTGNGIVDTVRKPLEVLDGIARPRPESVGRDIS